MARQTNIHDIFNWLENSRDELMNKFIYRMIPNKRDAKDFFNDLFIILADKDFNKIKTIYDNDEMSQYLYVIIRNNLQSTSSRYYYTYRKPVGSDYNEETDFRLSNDSIDKDRILNELQDDYKRLMNRIKKHLDNEVIKNPKFFYDKKVFEMYYEDDNTFRGLGELLDIPMSSIYNTVTRSRTKLVKRFKKDIEVIRVKLTSFNECV
jgi:RNA polymerase sigma factor (sigma-70 family)